MQLTKKQKVYYARILDTVGLFEVIDLRIRTVEDDWFVGIEDRTKHAYLFSNNALNKDIFFDREEAVNKVKIAEKNCTKKFSGEKYYEKY